MMKRSFDMTVSALGLIILSPVFLIISLLIKIKMGGSVLFKQERAGRYGYSFRMYKFRTMTEEADVNGNLLSDEQRITSLGVFLRSTSLDEFPELVNVLKGDMSLVGPRPLLVNYLPHYNAYQKQRHDILPGITGWAQVNGRNNLGWDEKLDYDVWYVRNKNFLLDLNILRLTFLKVFKREGINHGNSKGMPRFDEYVKEKTAK